MAVFAASSDEPLGAHSARREISQDESDLHEAFRVHTGNRRLKELNLAIRRAREAGVPEGIISNLINSYGLRFKIY